MLETQRQKQEDAFNAKETALSNQIQDLNNQIS